MMNIKHILQGGKSRSISDGVPHNCIGFYNRPNQANAVELSEFAAIQVRVKPPV